MEAERERGERDAHIVVGGKKRSAPKSRQARVKGRVCPTRFTRLRPRALAPFFFPPTTMAPIILTSLPLSLLSSPAILFPLCKSTRVYQCFVEWGQEDGF